LGVATDYQGALATALQLIERDIRETKPVERARTRYVVNFISDGVPDPTCQQGCDDDDGGLCNIEEDIRERDDVSDDEYVGFEGACPAYNQPRQIVNRVQEIVDLDRNFNLGDVRLNTVLLYSLDADAEEVVGATREKASQILSSMAEEGDGTFRDVDTASASDNFLEFEVTSVAADRTLTAMFTRNAHARRVGGEVMPEIDGDGLPDSYEFENDLDAEKPDTDGDGYTDGFEKVLADEGFDPSDGSIPAANCPSDADRDGDVLRDCEEEILETNPRQPAPDGDGMSDGIDVLAGTEPTEEDARNDLDNDGVENLAEARGGTDPSTPDEEVYRNDRINYDVQELGVREFRTGGEERRCYSYQVSRIPLATTPIERNRGLNRILIRGAERPAKIAGLSPEVQTACVDAYFNEGDKRPEDGVIELSQKTIEQTRSSIRSRIEELVGCDRFGGQPDRGDVEFVVEQCMEPKVEIANRLYDREAIFGMMRRHLESDLSVRLPDRSFEFFAPLASFDPSTDCFRPWEIDRVEILLDRAAEACRSCGGEWSADAGGGSNAEP
jgi:hypothetical protein